MVLLELYKGEEFYFSKEFDRVVLTLERRAPTDENIYLRINADKELSDFENYDSVNLNSAFEEIDLIRKNVFDTIKITYPNKSSKIINKNMFINSVIFDPLSNGVFMERIIFHEVE